MSTIQNVDLTDAEELERALTTFPVSHCAKVIAKRVKTMQDAWEEKKVAELDYQREFKMGLAAQLLSGRNLGEETMKSALKHVEMLFDLTEPK